MNHTGKQSKHGTSGGGGTPWREKLSTKIISCIVTLSLVFTVPLPAFAEQTDTAAATANTAAQTVVTENTAQVSEATATVAETDAAVETQAATAVTATETSATETVAETADTTAATEEAELDGAITKAVKIIVKGAVRGIKAVVGYFDQSEAITLSGDVYIEEDTTCQPIIVGEGGLRLIIKDGVTLTIDARNMENYAGIKCDGDNPLTITAGTNDDGSPDPQGTGKLIIYGSDSCAAIGGNSQSGGKNITIESCYVEAYGGKYGAGIGGGNNRDGENITINGGTVKAYGGKNAAGIGGGASPGCEGVFKNITINGGTVYAYGGEAGAGIGTGKEGAAEGIYINENIEGVSTYVEAHGGAKAAGIGNGDKGTGYKEARDIYITGGTVKAYGSGDSDSKNGGAGIGSGNGRSASNINISGGDVYAEAKNQAAAIGGGSDGDGYDITISGGTVTANAYGSDSYEDGAGIGGGRNNDGYRITISGGTVTAKSGHGAGIGGGTDGNLKDDQYGVDISSGHVEAYSYGNGAGIGGGSNGVCEGSITISGSSTYVNAYAEGGGAGIGGGYEKDSYNITINDGTVIATSKGTGAGIGSGSEGKAQGTIKINGGNVEARGGGDQNSCEKKNNTGSAIGCGATNSKVSDDNENKRVNAVYVTPELSATCYYSGTWPAAGPYGGNWAKNGGDMVNFSKWRYVKISNDVERGVTIGNQTDTPEYGTAGTSAYDLTVNYVSGTNWSIQWYKDGKAIDEAPASYSVSSDMKKLYLEYAGKADAGEYTFTLTCDGVTSKEASYKIDKRDATITSGSAKKVYDGTPLTCATCETSGFLEGQGVYVTCTGSCTGSAEQTEPTVAQNTFTYVAKAGTNLDNYDILETEGTLTVVKELFVVTAGNYEGKYDGNTHRFNDESNGTKVKVTTKNGIECSSVATIEYSTSETAAADSWSDWTADVPSVKNAGTLYVKVRASATITGQTATIYADGMYTMEVSKRNVTLTSADDEQEYNGEALICEGKTVGGDGFAGTESATIEYTGSQTKAGSSANSFYYELNGGAIAENYNITKIEGTLTVTPKSDPITIKTTSKTWKYDGQAHYACTKDDWTYYGELVAGETLDVNFYHTDANPIVDAGTYANSLADNEDLHKKAYRVTDVNGEDVTNCYTFNAVVEGTLTIDKREVTLTSGNDLKVWAKEGDYAYNGTVNDSGDGLLSGEGLTYSGFQKVTEVSYTPTDNTFEYEAADGSSFKENNYNITKVCGKLMLVKEMSIAVEDQTFTYDGTQHTAPVTVVESSEGAKASVEYATSKDGKEYSSYSVNVPTIKDAGTLYIKAKATKGEQVKEVSYTATVEKRSVVIKSDSSTKSYDGMALTDSSYSFSGQGFVDGEGATVTVTGSQTDVGSSSNSFSYTLKGNTNPDNYAIGEQPGTLTVTPCADAITITTGTSEVAYNGSPLTSSAWTATFGDKTLQPEEGSSQATLPDTGDILAVSCTGSITDVGTTQNTCTYRVLRKGTGEDITAYYTFADSVYGTLTVTPRSVVINTDSAQKTYDGKDLTKASYSVTGDGFIDGQDFDTVNVAGTITNAGTTPNTLDSTNPYTLKEGTNPANYQITVNPGTLTVNKRSVMVTSGSAIKTAKAASVDPATNATVTVAGDGFVSGEMADGYPKGVGSQSVTGQSQNYIEYSWTGAGNPANYQITETLGTLKVVEDSQAAAIATGYTGVYDGQYHSGTVTTIKEDVTIEYSTDNGGHWSTENPKFKDFGTTDVMVKVTDTEGNTFECSFTVEITQRPLTLTAGSASKVYDGTALTCNDYTVGGDGFAAGEEQTITMTNDSTVKDAGSHENTIKPLTKTETFNPSNYKISYETGMLEVTKRPLILYSKPIGVTESLQTIGTDPITYDGQEHSDDTVIEVGKGQVEGIAKIPGMGFAEGEGATYTFNTFTDAGTYMNTFTVNWNDGTNKNNYDYKILFGTVTIDQREVTLTSKDDSKMYDGEPLTNTVIEETGEGFVKDEGVDYVVTGTQTDVGTSANTFDYDFKANTKGSNYDIVGVEGTLTVTINDKLRVVVPETKEYTYDGTSHGEAAKAYVGDVERSDMTVWYSTDGGATYTDTMATRLGSGVTDVKVRVEESGYVTAEGSYQIIVKAAEASPTVDEIIAVDANQEDVEAAVKSYTDAHGLSNYHAYASIVAKTNELSDPDDLSKLEAAAPGKVLKYANVELRLSIYDNEGNYVTAEGITYKDYNIGNDNLIPVKISYRNDSAGQKDFECLRVHQGTAEKLPQGESAAVAGEYWTIDEAAGSMAVAASAYSTYALAYAPGSYVNYSAHVENIGWQESASDGQVAGTEGQGSRLEAVKIDLGSISGGVEYRTHVQNEGWEETYAANGEMSGTEGESLRTEAIQIRLTGNAANNYDVYYRVHAQNIGWMAWAKNGESAGTEGYAYRLEALQIVLVKKGEAAPTEVEGITSDVIYAFDSAEEGISDPYADELVSYNAHVQNIGWQNWSRLGGIVGTSGQALRVEALRMNLGGEAAKYSGSIEYSAHVQNQGWQDYVADGQVAGTMGESLRTEAIQIKLTGEVADNYDVYYRVHVQNIGWMAWAKNGEASGSEGYAYRLEGMQVVLVEKGAPAPGTTYGGLSSDVDYAFLGQHE